MSKNRKCSLVEVNAVSMFCLLWCFYRGTAAWTFLWFICFCVLANQWSKTSKDNIVRGDAARAVIAFSFFSIPTWVSLSSTLASIWLTKSHDNIRVSRLKLHLLILSTGPPDLLCARTLSPRCQRVWPGVQRPSQRPQHSVPARSVPRQQRPHGLPAVAFPPQSGAARGLPASSLLKDWHSNTRIQRGSFLLFFF